MQKVYINGVGSISAQKTFDNAEFLDELQDYKETVIKAIDPIYKDFIPAGAARRMAKGIKMGVVASKIALNECGLENVDAIITGTGLGCVRDSEKFVSAIIDNDEQYLTPTSFIQSTHNTVGGQIALELQCKGYNFTYVNASNSFESALLDAKLQLELKEAQNILLGGVDELGDHTVAIHRLINHIKPQAVELSEVLDAQTEGAVFSEGANFFVMSNRKEQSTYAEVTSVALFNTLSLSEVEHAAIQFLNDQGLETDDVDMLVLGNNGDVNYDVYYQELSSGVFKCIPHICYKHLCGEFYTASSFGFWLASKILRTQTLPEIVLRNTLKPSLFNSILLYNQYRGENHSFILLKSC